MARPTGFNKVAILLKLKDKEDLIDTSSHIDLIDDVQFKMDGFILKTALDIKNGGKDFFDYFKNPANEGFVLQDLEKIYFVPLNYEGEKVGEWKLAYDNLTLKNWESNKENSYSTYNEIYEFNGNFVRNPDSLKV